ncbi:MAG: universal stress protein [Candidatus Bathyarchaeota archaeon]|nr:universal stress protein [Candidatus Bathyarchaeota archaeon]
MNKILVPIDGSAASVMAEETAATIAKKTGASVTVLHVMPEMRIGYRLPTNIQDELLGSVQQHAESIINSARALFAEEKVKVETEIFSGDLANSILEFSKEYYDLLVIGAHGENEKDPYALGSVTKKVIMYAVCPTLIVKKLSSLSNLLLCVDGSKNSIKALKYALGLAEKLRAKVTLLNVQDQKLYKASPKTAKEIGDKILSKSLVETGKTKIKIDKRLEFGVPSDKIVEVAEQGNYDLIILGSRGLGTIRRFLLGSVSDDVSHKAKCSVLIIPAKA